MYRLDTILTASAVRAGVSVAHKKALFQQLAALTAKAHRQDEQAVFDCLSEREKLGSTGFGNGIAIPHGKIAGLDQVIGVCLRLANPLDYEAIDDLPVDLVFMLISPVDGGAEHLKALAAVSRVLRDKRFVAKLRGAASDGAMLALFDSSEVQHAAA